MIDELRIRGLGVIDEAVLPLGPGLTVVTGETGAGKTMVVTGLLLLFGGRGDAARVRAGASQASVDGRLRLPGGSAVADRVRAAGGELDTDADGDELVIRRTVTATGRSRAYVGGAATPVAVLGELAEHLLTVHGQSDQLRLARTGAQRDALDRFARLDLTEYSAAFGVWRDAQQRLDERVSRAAELRREADLLGHGIAEIEAADPQPGEDAELAAATSRLAHAEELGLAARAAHDAVLGSPDDFGAGTADVSALLGTAARALDHVAGADAELDALAGRVAELAAVAGDVGAELRSYADRLDTDPAELAALEERRSVVTALVRKYCDEPEPSIDAVLRWAERARTRLAEIDVSDEAIAALRADRDAAARAAATHAARISAARRKAAASLSAAVSAELSGLAMADARLEIAVDLRKPTGSQPVLTVDGTEVGAGPDGVDDVEFRLTAHAGAPPLPIGRGASGGELSRVMLALEVCLAGSDPLPTMVFDEVDAGVGGRAAIEVGRRLARLAADRQVLVVTHLAQVAAFADRHVVVHKAAQPTDAGERGGSTDASVTASGVRPVTGADRLAELARMLGGSDTAAAREHAAELLAEAARDVDRLAAG